MRFNRRHQHAADRRYHTEDSYLFALNRGDDFFGVELRNNTKRAAEHGGIDQTPHACAMRHRRHHEIAVVRTNPPLAAVHEAMLDQKIGMGNDDALGLACRSRRIENCSFILRQRQGWQRPVILKAKGGEIFQTTEGAADRKSEHSRTLADDVLRNGVRAL